MCLIFQSFPYSAAALCAPAAKSGRATLKTLAMVVLVAGLSACAKESPEYLSQARQDLASAAYAKAVTAAEAGLKGDPNEVTAWGLELVKLEAHARAGQGAEARAQLEKLSRLYPERISAAEYSGAAQQLQAAEQGPAAIEVLDLGAKRYPDDKLIAAMIKDSVSGGVNPAELEMLKSLGYIE